ncbi:MAG: hypothetical protein IPM23_12240 [Candidatus Melainabacteria bacterium]|nr:hypothetical protein [Candidatus Melainabacteria bacterium]
MSNSSSSEAERRPVSNLVFIFGVFLPLVAGLFEFCSHFCAQHFFDPFPSLNHLILFLLIPLSNFLVWLTRHKDMSQHYAFMALSCGMALGVGVMYSLMFLPLLGLCLLFSLAVIGLFGLAPLISLPVSYSSGKRVVELARGKTYIDPHQLEHMGHMIILVMVIAIELPSTLTRINLGNGDIDWLRHFGNREVMLRACYERSGRATDIVGSLYESAHPLPVERAREIYYLATGDAFNTVPIPKTARATIRHAGLAEDVAGVNNLVDDEFDLDADIAGEVVSGKARGLTATSSGITGRLDGDAATAEIDWSIDLHNGSRYEREGRAKLLLPPGGAVTAATLEMDGVKRRSVIMVRGEARVRYVQAVAMRKDPLLVSACGPDRILIQCFPVRPGKTARVTVSITAPLAVSSLDRASLSLPVMLERNFDDTSCRHSVDIGADNRAGSRFDLMSPAYAAGSSVSSRASTAKSLPAVFASRDRRVTEVYAADRFRGEGAIIRKEIAPESYPRPSFLTVIVDGSRFMEEYARSIASGLAKLPLDIPHKIVFVRDGRIELENAGELAGKAGQCAGGQDDSEALLKALRTGNTGSAILWIRGAQPICKADNSEIRHALARYQGQPVIYDFLVKPGPTQLLDQLYVNGSYVRVARTGKIEGDLESLFDSWRRPPSRAGSSPVSRLPENARVVEGDSIARLYGNGELLKEVGNCFPDGAPADSPGARAIAFKYRLVSPVSSAIVKTDYVEEKEKEKTAQAVSVNTGVAPEADTWLMIVLALGAVVYCQRRHRPGENRA